MTPHENALSTVRSFPGATKEQVDELEKMLRLAPFQFIVRGPMVRGGDSYMMSLGYFFNGIWRTWYAEISVTERETWWEVFTELYSNVYDAWSRVGQPRHPYPGSKSVWMNP